VLAGGLAIAVWTAGGANVNGPKAPTPPAPAAALRAESPQPEGAQGIDEYQQPERVKVGAADDRPPAEREPPPSTARDAPRTRRRGWVFLGTHDAATRSWTKSYFNVGQKRPEDIKPGQTVLVAQGRSNVRGGMPNQLGLFYDVIDVVREGTGVSIDAVARWQNSPYVWAKVHYDAAPAR
jgi:hypothetical protein